MFRETHHDRSFSCRGKWLLPFLAVLLLQPLVAASASLPLPLTPSGSSALLQQIVVSSKKVMPGYDYESITFGLRDEMISVRFSDYPNDKHPFQFWLIDGELVPTGSRDAYGVWTSFTTNDLTLLEPNFDGILQDAKAFAESNGLGIDKRTFLSPNFPSVPGSTFSSEDPVVEFWLGDPSQANSSGNYPCLFRIYSMRTGKLLWQATAEDTDVVFQFFTD